MSLKSNDRVRIDGREGRITLVYAAGKHRKFVLDDGREFFDLDKLLASGSSRISLTTPAEASLDQFETTRSLPEPEEENDEDSEEETAYPSY